MATLVLLLREAFHYLPPPALWGRSATGGLRAAVRKSSYEYSKNAWRRFSRPADHGTGDKGLVRRLAEPNLMALIGRCGALPGRR